MCKSKLKTLKDIQESYGYAPKKYASFCLDLRQELGIKRIEHYLSLLDKDGVKYIIHNGKIGIEKDYEYELKVEDHMKIAVIGTLLSMFNICEHKFELKKKGH